MTMNELLEFLAELDTETGDLPIVITKRRRPVEIIGVTVAHGHHILLHSEAINRERRPTNPNS